MMISNYLLSPQTSKIQTSSSRPAVTCAYYFTEKQKPLKRNSTSCYHRISQAARSPLLPFFWKQCLHSYLSQSLGLRSGSCLLLQWSTLFSNTHFPSLLEYSYLHIFKVILNKTSLAPPANTIMYLPSQQNALSYLSLLTSFLFFCSL